MHFSEFAGCVVDCRMRRRGVSKLLTISAGGTTGGATSIPSAFSMSYLSGKTLYGVWFGDGTDASGNAKHNVPVVLKVVYGVTGTAQTTGLLNYVSQSASYGVTASGLLYFEGDTTQGNTIVSGSTSQYIKASHMVSGVSEGGAVLMYFDQSAAMAYANTLHAVIPF